MSLEKVRSEWCYNSNIDSYDYSIDDYTISIFINNKDRYTINMSFSESWYIYHVYFRTSCIKSCHATALINTTSKQLYNNLKKFTKFMNKFDGHCFHINDLLTDYLFGGGYAC